MPYYIESESEGLFIGSVMGVAIFQSAELTGPGNVPLPPLRWLTKSAAELYLSEWEGEHDCRVVFYGEG